MSQGRRGPDSGRSGAGRLGSLSFGADLLTDLFVHPLDPGYADAAERRRAVGGVSGRRRVWGQAGTAVVLVLFGLLLSVAYQQVVATAPEAARARERLVDDVVAARDESQALERRAARLRDDVAAERGRALGAEADRLRDLEAGSGLARVSGPGMSVTLTDAPPEVDPVSGEPSGENLGRVLDRDLQRVVNALWASGAEAVAVNGQRLSATSAIRGAGEAVLVDFTPVKSPYVVRAVGPPGMAQRFNGSRTAEQLQWLHEKYRMGVRVSVHDEIRLPAASEPRLRYAEPATVSPSPTGSGR